MYIFIRAEFTIDLLIIFFSSGGVYNSPFILTQKLYRDMRGSLQIAKYVK
jgi:hypothetical protein